MGVLLGGSFLILTVMIAFLTYYFITQHYEIFLEITNQESLKGYMISLMISLVSLVIIFGYVSGIGDESDVMGTSVSNGGGVYFMISVVGLFAFLSLSICMKIAMEAYPEEQRKYGMLNRLYVNLSSICSVILIIALLTTTQNKSLSHRIVVLVAGCFVLLHVNIMHRTHWMCYPESDE